MLTIAVILCFLPIVTLSEAVMFYSSASFLFRKTNGFPPESIPKILTFNCINQSSFLLLSFIILLQMEQLAKGGSAQNHILNDLIS